MNTVFIHIDPVPDVIILNERQQKLVERLRNYFIWAVVLTATFLILTLMGSSQQDLKFDFLPVFWG